MNRLKCVLCDKEDNTGELHRGVFWCHNCINGMEKERMVWIEEETRRWKN